MNTKILGIGAAMILAVGGSFFGGMQFAKAQRSATPQQFSGQFMRSNGQSGGSGMRGGTNGGGFVSGEIIAKDDQSITVKEQNGSTKIIFLSEKTTVSKMAEGSRDDLAVGTSVLTTGTTNTDGSVSASSVQIRPAMPIPAATP